MAHPGLVLRPRQTQAAGPDTVDGAGVQGRPPGDNAILVELDALEPRESIIDWGRRQQHAPKLKAPEAVTAVKVEGILSQRRSVRGTLS
jgi:hypothetical protein